MKKIVKFWVCAATVLALCGSAGARERRTSTRSTATGARS